MEERRLTIWINEADLDGNAVRQKPIRTNLDPFEQVFEEGQVKSNWNWQASMRNSMKVDRGMRLDFWTLTEAYVQQWTSLGWGNDDDETEGKARVKIVTSEMKWSLPTPTENGHDVMYVCNGQTLGLLHIYNPRFIHEGVAGASPIFLRHAHVLQKLLSYEEYYRSGGKSIAVWSQSISGVSAINPFVAFYDIHVRKTGVHLFYFVPDTTRDLLRFLWCHKHWSPILW
jgi:hypothetical protein